MINILKIYELRRQVIIPAPVGEADSLFVCPASTGENLFFQGKIDSRIFWQVTRNLVDIIAFLFLETE